MSSDRSAQRADRRERTEERLTFLALAQHRLGNPEEARTAVGRLHLIANQPGQQQYVRAPAPFRESEALEQDLAFPADPFAP